MLMSRTWQFLCCSGIFFMSSGCWTVMGLTALLRRFLRLSTMRMKYNRTTVCDGSFDIAYPDLLGKLFIATFFFSLRLCCLLSTRHNRACFAPGGCDHTHRLPNMCPPCMCENLPGRCLSFAFCGSPGTRALSVITHAALAVTFEIWGGKNSPIAIAWGC